MHGLTAIDVVPRTIIIRVVRIKCIIIQQAALYRVWTAKQK